MPFSPAPGFVGFAWNIPGVPLVGTTIYPPAGTRDDVQFLSHAIDVAGSVACIDAKRVYATGVSGGGRMASQLACDLPDRIAAIAPISGVRFPEASDTPPNTVSCDARPGHPGDRHPRRVGPGQRLRRHAAARGRHAAGRRSTRRWPARRGATRPRRPSPAGPTTTAASPTPRVKAATPNIDVISYRACQANADVVLYKVKNSGHASPGHGIPAYDFLLNPTNNEVDGTQVAWDFLSRYHLK